MAKPEHQLRLLRFGTSKSTLKASALAHKNNLSLRKRCTAVNRSLYHDDPSCRIVGISSSCGLNSSPGFDAKPVVYGYS
jgi:hypothetical protein